MVEKQIPYFRNAAANILFQKKPHFFGGRCATILFQMKKYMYSKKTNCWFFILAESNNEKFFEILQIFSKRLGYYTS